MNILGLIGIFFSLSLAVHAGSKTQCTPPTLIKPIEDITIVAFNVATIDTKAYFTGSNLHYILHHKRTKAQNIVNIDQSTGKITIDAESKETVDMRVTAKNACGILNAAFNVQIDEEE